MMVVAIGKKEVYLTQNALNEDEGQRITEAHIFQSTCSILSLMDFIATSNKGSKSYDK